MMADEVVLKKVFISEPCMLMNRQNLRYIYIIHKLQKRDPGIRGGGDASC
jgi:hypothetical protein